MSKIFLYCEATDGGMIDFIVQSPKDLRGVFGWMDENVRDDDEALVAWMEQAEVGQYYDHRAGIMVRLRDDSFIE